MAGETKEMGGEALAAEAPREKTFLLAAPEEKALTWLAARLPKRVLPDHLTSLGVLAALGIAAAYLLADDHPAALWVASGLLVVHWLGDSLDGTLARFRRIERPTYGYYLDHLVDAFATAVICIGLGLSPHMLLATGLTIAIAYLLLSINTYLETSAFGRFDLGYGRVGPTEIRVVLIGLNIALALGVDMAGEIAGVGITLLDGIGLGVAGVMVGALAARAAKNLRVLAEREPAGTVRA